MKITALVVFTLFTLIGCAENATQSPAGNGSAEAAPPVPSRTSQVPGTTSQNPGNTLPTRNNGGNTAGTAVGR